MQVTSCWPNTGNDLAAKRADQVLHCALHPGNFAVVILLNEEVEEDILLQR
jgi:hypothetical protein